jgi:hypothetical protein
LPTTGAGLTGGPKNAIITLSAGFIWGTPDHQNGKSPIELPPLPTAEALTIMRKKARKRKVPKVDVGSHGHLHGVGQFKIIETDGAVSLEWQIADSETKRFTFEDLCQNPDFDAQRLEVGWLIANIWMIEERKVRDAIPDPNEAMRESSRYFEAEDTWRHWSQVLAGHMILSPQS